METIRIPMIAATSLTALVAQAVPVSPDMGAFDFERLGVSVVVVGLLFWLFQGERKERQEAQKKVTESLEKTLARNQEVLEHYAEAVKENAASNKALSAAISRMEGRHGSSLPD